MFCTKTAIHSKMCALLRILDSGFRMTIGNRPCFLEMMPNRGLFDLLPGPRDNGCLYKLLIQNGLSASSVSLSGSADNGSSAIASNSGLNMARPLARGGCKAINPRCATRLRNYLVAANQNRGLSPIVPADLFVYYPTGRNMPARMRAFIEFLVARLNRDGRDSATPLHRRRSMLQTLPNGARE